MNGGGHAERSAVERAFVGRERERVELRAALDDADAGRGSLFLISGEPGIGKTRLADELAAEAASRGMRVAWGRCWETAAAPAYWPWVEIVRALVLEPGRAKPPQTAIPPEIGQLIPELSPETIQPSISSDPEQARFRLFDAVATLLKQVARAGPLVLILDDLHEADRSSLELLKFVARGLTDSRIVIVGTHRDAEVRRSPDLAKSIAEVLRHGNPMPLAGLDESEVAQMIEHRADRSPSGAFASELHQVTAGNPLFVNGIIRVLFAEDKLGTADHLDLRGFKLPEGVRGAIRRHLALLSAEAQSALAVAAVIGQEFGTTLLQRVIDSSAEALAELMREASEVGIVTAASRESYRFTHPLIREALYNESAEVERLRLHRAIGEALEQMYSANLTPHLAALAHHFREAGVFERAIDYSIRAGEAASAVFAYQEAADQLQAALDLMEKAGVDAERRAGLFARLAFVTYSFDEAGNVASLEQALKLYETAGRTDRLVALHITLGIRRSTPTAMMDVPKGLEHFQKAEATLVRAPSERARALLDFGISISAARRLRIEEGLAASSRAMEIADRLNDRGLCANVGGARALLLCWAGRLAEGFALLDEAYRTADALNDPGALYGVNVVLTSMTGWLSDPQMQVTLVERELAKPRTAHATYHQAFYKGCLHTALACIGRLAEAKRYLWEGTDAYVALFEGRWEDAERQCAAYEDWLANCGSRREATGFFQPLAFARRLQGKHSLAESQLLEAIAFFRGETLLGHEMQIRPELTLLYADMNRDAEGRPNVERCREIMAAGENWRGLAGHAARAEAVVTAADGDLTTAESQFEKAIQIYRRYTLPWEEAETLYYWGRALKGLGKSSANEKFDAAIEIYKRYGGGQRWIDRVEAARKPATAHTSQESSSVARGQAIFRKEGDFWTIAYSEKTFRLRNVKGLAYIATLLAHPGERIHVCDLVAMVEGLAADGVADGRTDRAGAARLKVARDLGDAGEALDTRAIADYRSRRAEVLAELEEAERDNDLGRATRARQEYEFLQSELGAAVGHGGRSRRVFAHAERARALVTKSIRSSLDLIASNDAKLGQHFKTCIRTGSFCAYLPDPDRKPSWQL